MNAKELHDAYVKYGLAAILGPDGVIPIVERALSLLAAVEGSQEEIVRELRGFVDHLHERGHDGDAQLVDDAAARIVADAQEKERLRAELASVKANCKIVYWPKDGSYPIEHTMAANKDCYEMILAQMERDRAATKDAQ